MGIFFLKQTWASSLSSRDGHLLSQVEMGIFSLKQRWVSSLSNRDGHLLSQAGMSIVFVNEGAV